MNFPIKEEKCHLCLQEKKLCKSHIIPEFFYKQMKIYDENHRFHVLSTNPKKTQKKMPQKGIWEKLLCSDCEEKFSRWETYVRSVFYGNQLRVVHQNEKFIEILVDFHFFKLFQLSILWRSGICTRNEFKSISLGFHQNSIREMLKNETPGDAEKYGCILIAPQGHSEITENIIHPMGNITIDQVDCTRLLFGGLLWLFFQSKNALNLNQKDLFLQETGSLKILKSKKGLNRYIEQLAIDIHTSNPSKFK